MRPKMGYLYRAVDKDGKTVDSLFQISRGVAAAMAFFRRAVETSGSRWPRKITMDGHRATTQDSAASVERIIDGSTVRCGRAGI